MLKALILSILLHRTAIYAFFVPPSQRSTHKKPTCIVSNKFTKGGKQSLSNNSLYMTNENNQESSISYSDGNSNVLQELDLENTFNRWVFLKKVLDTDEDDDELKDTISIVTYKLIESFVVYPLNQRYQDYESRDDYSVETAFPAIADHLQEDILNNWVEIYQDKGRIPISLDNDNNDSNHIWDYELIMKLDLLLPLEYEDKDAYDGLWDTVNELHGEEMVKINIQEGNLDWDARCIIARFLIYYNFLRDGIIMKPIPFE